MSSSDTKIRMTDYWK